MAGNVEESVDSGGPGIAKRLSQNRYTGLIVNVMPGSLWLIVFFLIPLAFMFYFSLGERGAFGEVLVSQGHLGLQQYRKFFIPADANFIQAVWWTATWILEGIIPFDVFFASGEPTIYVKILSKSIVFGAIVTVFAMIVGYPVAYFITRIVSPERRKLALVLLLVPYWASFLVRVYAMMLLFFENGPIFRILNALPYIEGVSLIYTDMAVLLGMMYIYVPFMVLPLYTNLDDIDFTLQEAALVLGASRITAFRRVILPLSKPGIFAGSILVFIPATGTFVIPQILGGGSSPFIGRFIATQFGSAGNWPLGSAAGFIFTAVILVVIGLYQWTVGGGDLA